MSKHGPFLGVPGLKPESDIERAYRAGLAAALKQSISIVRNPIEAPIYDAIYSKRHAKNMTKAFWDGVNEWKHNQQLEMCANENLPH